MLNPSLIHKKQLNNTSKQYTGLSAKQQQFLLARKHKFKEGCIYNSGRKKSFLEKVKLDLGPKGYGGFIQMNL